MASATFKDDMQLTSPFSFSSFSSASDFGGAKTSSMFVHRVSFVRISACRS